MELETLIIADAVSTPPDDKFYVHGGGISRIEVPVLPFPIPLGVLLRVKIEDEDLRRSHHFQVALIGPLGRPNVPALEFDAAAAEDTNLLEGEERFANIGVQINAVAVRTGLYHVEVHIGGDLVRSVPIPVVLNQEAATLPTPREWPQTRALAKPPPRPPNKSKPKRRK